MSTTPKLGDSFSIDSSENTYAPGIAICRESASGGAINNQEIQDGTEVTISIAGSGAQPGDVLRVFIDDVLVAEHVLDASEISNSGGTTTGTGIAKVTISADVLKALAQGGHIVTSQIAYSDSTLSGVSPAKGTLIIDTIGPDAPVAPTATDDVGQTVGVIPEAATTDDANPIFSGTIAAKYNTIEVFDNGVSLGKATVNSITGKWTLTPLTALTDGPHAITVVEYDRAGNPSPTSAAMNFIVDTGPANVAITKVTDNVGDIQGDVATGGVTDDTTPTLVGTAKANTVVTISEGTTVLGTTTADALGHWEFTPASAQNQGAHTYTASITVAGNTTTSTNFVVTVDTTGPAVVVTPLGDNLKTAAEATAATGVMTVNSEDNAVSTVTFVGQNGQVVKTITNNGTAKPVVLTAADLITLGDGAVEVTTVTKDKAGNVTTTTDSADGDFTIDTVAALAVADVVNTTEDVISTTGNVGTNDTSKDGSESYSLIGSATGVYGTLALGSNGAYTYTRTANLDAIQITATDTFTYQVRDAAGNTTQSTLKINMAPVNDAAVISGVNTGSITESNAAQAVTGTLTIMDVDSSATFVVQTNVTGTNGYGKFSLNSAGVWTYTMNTAHDEFVVGTAYTDSFTATSADGTTKLITVTINGTNDTAVIGGTTIATLTQNATAQSATGTLSITDVDSAITFTALTDVAGSNGYGKFSLTSAGVWTYTMNTAHAEFVAGTAYTDSVTVTSADGTTKVVTVTINGTNDAAVIGGVSTATLTETNAAQTATGTLTITDVDSATTFVAQTATAGSNGYGKFSLTAAGVWTYTMNTAHDEFVAGTAYTDSFTATSADGTTKLITVTINGTNDAAVIGGVSTATLTETNAAQSATGTLTISDVDRATTFVAQTATAGSNGYGKFSLTAAGVWTYTMNTAHDEFAAGTAYTDSFTATSADGTTKLITVTINGINDAAVISGTSTGALTETNVVQSTMGSLISADVDGTANLFIAQTNVAGSNGYGKFSMTTAGSWTYTMNTAHDEFVAGTNYTDSITVAAADGTTQVVTVTITGANDAAVISGTSTGAVTEAGGVANAIVGTPTATGTLTSTDVDGTANAFTAVAAGTTSTSGYGTYAMTAGGVWTYTLNNANTTVQALAAAATLTDTFTVKAADGTAKTVTVTITGANDAAVISGTNTGAVTEAGGVANGTAGTPTATGTLTSTDVDGTANAFTAVTTSTTSTGGYGSFVMTAGGVWAYTLNNANTTVQALAAGATLTDTFTVSAADGTVKVVTLTINGTNDAAVIGGVSTATLTETNAVQSATGTLTITDVDSATTFTAQTNVAGSNGYGKFSVTAAGVWTYTLDNAHNEFIGGTSDTDSFTVVAADGTTKVITVTFVGTNDAPVLTDTVLTIPAVLQDSAVPTGAVGSLVGELVGGVSDADYGSPRGIAITGVSNGTVYFSTNGGTNWTAVTSASNTNALLLAADADNRIYFKPNAGYFGTAANAVTFRAWDATSGAEGSYVSTASNGGTTAFSSATDTISEQVVRPVAINTVSGDNVVIMNEAVPLTGTADAGATVTLNINGVTRTVVADASGNWSYSAKLVPEVRYIMVRDILDGSGPYTGTGVFAIDELNVVVNGSSVSAGKSAIYGVGTTVLGSTAAITEASATNYYETGTVGEVWVQLDLGGYYRADSITVTPRASWSDRVNGAKIYTAVTDMSVLTSAQLDAAAALPTPTVRSTLITGATAAGITYTQPNSSDEDTFINGVNSITASELVSGVSSTATTSVKWTNPPVVAPSKLATSYTEQAAAVVVNSGVTVVDVNSANITSATVSIGAGFTAGDTLAFTNANGITGSYNSATGVMTLSGSATVAKYQAALQSITFSSNSDAPTAISATRTINWQVNDGQAANNLSNVDTSTINVVAVNDAAVIGGTTTGTLTETNVAQTATGTLTISDVDSATTFVAQTATAGSNGYGKFSLTAAGVWTYTMNTAHDEFVAGVNYTDSFTATSADGTTKLVTVTMKGTNDQPTFTSSATIALSATEDTAYNFVIANSLVGKVTDVDAGASVKGIAISWNQAPIDQGVWEWSTDGTTWAAVPADITGVATTFNNPANALYLNASDRLRFTPAANWNGNVNALVFRVADDTMPATVSGTRLNVSSYNGSTGPMSLSPSSYTLNVSGVNDAPVIVTTANSITTLEDTATTFVIGTQLNGKVTDVDGTALKGIVIVQNTTTSGTWAYSTDGGTTWVDFPTTYLGSVDWTKVMYLNATDSLRYTPAANTSGANLSDLNFRAVDASFPNTASGTQVSVISSIGGSGSVSGQAGHFTVSVTAVNDAPIGTNDTASATEASGVSNATAGSNPSGNVLTNDTDQDNATSTLVIKDILKGTTGTATAVAASTTSANGTSIVGTYGTLVIGADGSYTYSVNQSNATVQALNTTSAPLSDVFTYTVKDPSGLTGRATITVSVNGANDAAVIGGVNTATLTETNAAQTATGTLTITDVDSATTFAAQTNVAGSNGYGKFSLTTAGAWTYTMNTAHDEFVVGTAYTDSFTAVSADGTTKLVTVTINGTNDAAVVTPNVTARSYTENAAAIIANNNLTLVDAENTNLVGATVQITSGLTAGDTLAFTAGNGITGTYDAATGKLSLAGSATVLQYQTALQSVVYSSTSDNPTASSASRTLSWQVNDGASANNLSNLGSSTINVVAVNDAAVIGGTATASLTETNVAQTASGTLTITDVDSAATFVAQTNVAGSNGYGKFSVTSAGVWSYTMNTAHDEFLVGQVYTDSITVASADGTTKLVTVSITGSNHAPTLSYVDTGSSSTDAITNNPAMSVSSLEAAATWEYQVDNGAWTVGTGTTFTMSEGQHTYNVRQKDVLNHVSASASKTVTLDTVAPNAAGITLASDAGISNTDGVTNNGTLNIALSSDTNNWQYTTNGGTTWSNGTGTTLGLAAGTYTANSVQVQAFDKAGNATLSKYASAVTVDTSAPTVSVAIGNSSLQYGQSTTVSFNFSEAVYGFANSDVSVSGGSLSNITGSGRSYSATYTAGYSYNGGSYVSVNANTYTDQAGNNGGSGSTGSFSVGINVADVARGMSLYVTGYGHGWCDTQGWIGVGLWGNNDLQGATVTLYDGWGHSWSSNVAGSGGSTNFGTFSGGGNNVTKFHADISYGGQTASVGGGVAYEVTWRGLVGLGFFNCIKGDTAYTFCYSSPIVLDLNGDGVQTVDTAHGVQFDMSGDGHTQSVGWVDKHDALLVRDINHDGKINNGTELFGSDTVLKNGQKAGDGWGALADMDSNADGKIDAQDAAFAEMQVWVDANGDGVTDAGELRGLIEAGIQSIDVTHANSNTSQNGNVLFGTGQFTKVDGTTAALTDAWFEVGRTLALDFTQVKGQALDMSDGQAQTVTLDFKELMAYTEVNGALQLSGDAADVVKIVNGGAAVTANRQDINGQVFNAYDLNLDGMNDLLLAQAMNQAQLF